VVVGEPPTEVATTVPTPSATTARPMTGSRSRLVISATALTWPTFSATSAMTAGCTSRLKFSEKLGAVKSGRPNQSASADGVEVDPVAGGHLAGAVGRGDLTDGRVEQDRQQVAEDQAEQGSRCGPRSPASSSEATMTNAIVASATHWSCGQ
jgi:hypothetical protein